MGDSQRHTDVEQYYKPWEMLPGDDEQIEVQIEETEATIAQEVEAFRKHHLGAEKESTTNEQVADSASKETVGEPHIEPASVFQEVLDTATTTTNVQEPSSAEEARKEALELHNGEVVVEAEEDTVIY